MTEPTDEQVAAFKAAWEAQRDAQEQGTAEPGERTRAGLRAVFALSEPYGDVRPLTDYIAEQLADRTMWSVEDWHYVIALANRTASPFAAGPQSRPYEPTPHRSTYIAPHAIDWRAEIARELRAVGITPAMIAPSVDRVVALMQGTPEPPDEELVTDPRIGTWRRHSFVGRLDRGCEACGLPDRSEVHSLVPGANARHAYEPLNGVPGRPCRICGRSDSAVRHLSPYTRPPTKNPTYGED